MPTIPLPENASIEHLKKQAKLIQQLVRSADDGALAMVHEFHPRAAELARSAGAISAFRRSDAQLVIARLYGFDSWPKLRDGVALVDRHRGLDPADDDDSSGARGADVREADRFVALACVSYNPIDVHGRLAEAQRLLGADPSLATGSPAAMAATGRHAELAALLDDDPELSNRSTGPNRWPLLLYCTYSRVVVGDADAAIETARSLLDHGADPDAGFLWRGLVPPFTALTGALGRGEGDQPPHPDRDRLLRLLLDAGADPNDGQGLYNNGLAGTANDDPSHLEILHDHGLGRPAGGPWYRRFGERLTPPQELLYDELEVAAWRNLPMRMRFLVGLGLDLDRGVGRSGRPPLDLAADQRHDEIVDILLEAGAAPSAE